MGCVFAAGVIGCCCLQGFKHIEYHTWFKPDAADAGGARTISATECFMTGTRHDNLETAFNMFGCPMNFRHNLAVCHTNRSKIKHNGVVVCKAEKNVLLQYHEYRIRCKARLGALVCHAGTGTDVIAAMSLGHSVTAIEPDPLMFSVLVARVRSYAQAMANDNAHWMLRRNWEQYFVVRPHEAAVERKKIADAAKKSKQELSKQVRNLKRRTVTKKVTETVAETTTADGDVVPAHEEENEEDVLEEEEDGDLLIPRNEGESVHDGGLGRRGLHRRPERAGESRGNRGREGSRAAVTGVLTGRRGAASRHAVPGGTAGDRMAGQYCLWRSLQHGLAARVRARA